MVKSDLWNSSRPQTNPGLNQGVKQKEEAQPIFLNLRSNPEKIDKQNIVFYPITLILFAFVGGLWRVFLYLAFWCFTTHPPTPKTPFLPLVARSPDRSWHCCRRRGSESLGRPHPPSVEGGNTSRVDAISGWWF